MPAAAGRCLSRVIDTGSPNASDAFQQRFLASSGTPAAIGPVTRSDISLARATVTRSPRSANITSESSR